MQFLYCNLGYICVIYGFKFFTNKNRMNIILILLSFENKFQFMLVRWLIYDILELLRNSKYRLQISNAFCCLDFANCFTQYLRLHSTLACLLVYAFDFLWATLPKYLLWQKWRFRKKEANVQIWQSKERCSSEVEVHEKCNRKRCQDPRIGKRWQLPNMVIDT